MKLKWHLLGIFFKGQNHNVKRVKIATSQLKYDWFSKLHIDNKKIVIWWNRLEMAFAVSSRRVTMWRHGSSIYNTLSWWKLIYRLKKCTTRNVKLDSSLDWYQIVFNERLIQARTLGKHYQSLKIFVATNLLITFKNTLLDFHYLYNFMLELYQNSNTVLWICFFAKLLLFRLSKLYYLILPY